MGEKMTTLKTTGFHENPVRWKVTVRLAAAVFLVTMLGAHPSWASATGDECDRLAANPEDPTRPASVPGVKVKNIAARQAIEACTAAVAEEPDNARYHFQLARAYQASKDMENANAHYKIAAEGGHKNAMRNYGSKLFDAQNFEEALYWLEKSEAKDEIALQKIGWIYAVIKQDYVKAKGHFLGAAELGDAYAQFNLGLMYQYGMGVDASNQEAIRWYRMAADQGLAEAQTNLAILTKNPSYEKPEGECHMVYEMDPSGRDDHVVCN